LQSLQRNGTPDLISGVQCGSGGQERGAAAEHAGAGVPAAARLEVHRSSAFPGFQWSFCLGFGPGMITATCVIHPGLLLSSGMAGAACAALVAVLRGGAHRREASWGFQGLRTLDPSEKGWQEVRVLTELENGGDGRAKSTVALTGGVVWTGARGGGRCSGVPASGLHG